MKSALKPSLENLDKAVARLEQTLDKKMQIIHKQTQIIEQLQQQPQLELSARSERDVNRKIAAKLDQTIERLETLLNDE